MSARSGLAPRVREEEKSASRARLEQSQAARKPQAWVPPQVARCLVVCQAFAMLVAAQWTFGEEARHVLHPRHCRRCWCWCCHQEEGPSGWGLFRRQQQAVALLQLAQVLLLLQLEELLPVLSQTHS